MLFFVSYLSSLLIMLTIDSIWLTNMMNVFYKPVMAPMLLDEINLKAAIAFYLIYPIGLVVFAILPGLEKKSLRSTIAHGGLLGFVAYATYDLTNQTTLKYWSTTLTIVDLAWGTILSALTCGLVYWLGSSRLVSRTAGNKSAGT